MLRNSFLIGCLVCDMRRAEKRMCNLEKEIMKLNMRLDELDKKTATHSADSPTESAQDSKK